MTRYLLLLLSLMFIGCDEPQRDPELDELIRELRALDSQPAYYQPATLPVAIPAYCPSCPQRRAVDLPIDMRHPNYKDGSCYYASLSSALEQIGRPELAQWVRDNFAYGAYIGDIQHVLDLASVDYVYTDSGDWNVLEYATRNGLMAAIEFHDNHACTFYDMDRSLDRVRVLNNNDIDRLEVYTLAEFHALWMRQGGRAIVPLGLPLPPSLTF